MSSSATVNYLKAGYGLKSWLFTLDHKRIAWLYFVSITGFFFLGGAAATLIRMELITPAFASGYYHYTGSLTTPPCTEGVVWALLRRQSHVCERQVRRSALKLTSQACWRDPTCMLLKAC